MQFKFLILLGAIVLLSGSVHAQHKPDPNTVFEVTRQIREAKRKAIVAENLGLNEMEAEKFWPAYDDYRAKIKKKEKVRLGLLKQFSENITDLQGEDAASMVPRALDLEIEIQQLKKEHIAGLKPIFSVTKFFRYYQIETKLDARFKFGWTKRIPLAPANKGDVVVIEVPQEQ